MKRSDAIEYASKKEQILHEAKGVIRSLGLVFGDIGTSPIYTLTVIFILFCIGPVVYFF